MGREIIYKCEMLLLLHIGEGKGEIIERCLSFFVLLIVCFIGVIENNIRFLFVGKEMCDV